MRLFLPIFLFTSLFHPIPCVSMCPWVNTYFSLPEHIEVWFISENLSLTSEIGWLVTDEPNNVQIMLTFDRVIIGDPGVPTVIVWKANNQFANGEVRIVSGEVAGYQIGYLPIYLSKSTNYRR